MTRRDLFRTAGALALGAEIGAPGAEAADKLPRRVLGKTGVRVPILGFGTAPCGIRRDIKNGVALYNEAINLGVNYMDTAPTHTGYGRAQEQLGHVLQDRRREVFVVTKCHESGGDAALRLLQKNLKELRTDHADLVYVHSLGDEKTDRRITFLAPADAPYFIELTDAEGRNAPGLLYRLTLRRKDP